MKTAVGLMLIVIILAIIACLFGVLVYPIWMLVHCATAEGRSSKSKTVWLIFMILGWPVVGYLYGLFGSKRRFFKQISSVLIVLLISLIIIFVAATAYLNQHWRSQIAKDIARIDAVRILILNDTQREALKRGLLILDRELKPGMTRLERKFVIYNLVEMFGVIAEDDEITPSEYRDWVDKFKSRKTIDRNVLERYIHDLQKGKD